MITITSNELDSYLLDKSLKNKIITSSGNSSSISVSALIDIVGINGCLDVLACVDFSKGSSLSLEFAKLCTSKCVDKISTHFSDNECAVICDYVLNGIGITEDINALISNKIYIEKKDTDQEHTESCRLAIESILSLLKATKADSPQALSYFVSECADYSYRSESFITFEREIEKIKESIKISGEDRKPNALEMRHVESETVKAMNSAKEAYSNKLKEILTD